MPTLNLGIVAHVDAGKTTLTERLLFDAGVIAHIGRVDHGDTTTDTDVLERQRGITIRSAVVTFTVGDTKVNLIDTPGHSDFVAEVERALGVLDGAVLVVSAVEGVQAQTRVLIRILERLRMPFVIFVNKIDRMGAAYPETMVALRRALCGDAIAMTEPVRLGSRTAISAPREPQGLLEEVAERVAEYDESTFDRYVDGKHPIDGPEARALVRRFTGTGDLHPVYFGSAMLGVGVRDLVDGIDCYLPTGDPISDPPLHATVFKIERGPGGRRVAYARLHTGGLAARDHVSSYRRTATGGVAELQGRVTSVRTFTAGTRTSEEPARMGDIATIVGLGDTQIGDQLGRWDASMGGRYFAPPGLEAVVRTCDAAARPALFEALHRLSEQDPLIDARLDGVDNELTVSLYGEVQKEVLAARLLSEFGVDAEFLPTRTVYVERPSASGTAVTMIGAPGNDDLATVGIRVEPGAVGSGLVYRREVELGGLLLSFHTAIEETVAATLQEGPLGWRVVDCIVTLTHSGYWAPVSSAGDFRRLTALVLTTALVRAGTTVCEPYSEVEIEFPRDTLSPVLQRLVAAGATPGDPDLSRSRGRLDALLPTSALHELEQRLPGLTRGEGFLLARPGGYRPVQGSPPSRLRSSTVSIAVDGRRRR